MAAVEVPVLKHPSFKLPAFWEGMFFVSGSHGVTMWCFLVLYYFICCILLSWCLLFFEVLSVILVQSLAQIHVISKKADYERRVSLPDTRGQDASKKLLQGLSETVYFKGSFWTETLPFCALQTLVWSLAACWRAKCHIEQVVISHSASRLKSATNGNLKIG